MLARKAPRPASERCDLGDNEPKQRRSSGLERAVCRCHPQVGRLIASLRAQLELRLGYVPALFEPAFASAELLEALWQQTRAAYLDNPLPPRFKEALLLSVMRRCPTPYGLVGHAAALARHGVSAAEVSRCSTTASRAAATEFERHLEVLRQVQRGVDAVAEVRGRWPTRRWRPRSRTRSSRPSCEAGAGGAAAAAAATCTCAGRRCWPTRGALAVVRGVPGAGEADRGGAGGVAGAAAGGGAAVGGAPEPGGDAARDAAGGRRPAPTPDALSQIIDAVPTGILQLSIDGAVVMTNAPAQRMFGLTADEFSKLTVSDLEPRRCRRTASRARRRRSR
jgi:PAS domain-containing protein